MRMVGSRVGKSAAVAVALLLAAVLPASVALAVNPGSGTTGTGQTLNIQIDSPLDGSSVAVPPGSVTVSGRTSIGALASANNAYYMLDVSGSTGSNAGDCNGDGVVNAGDNFNTDFTNGDVLDCEIAGVLALNASLGAAAVDVGLGAFSSGTPANGDVDPTTGIQLFTTPVNADKNTNGRPDIEDVSRSVVRTSIGQFTSRTAGSGGTDFNQALTAINAAFATQPASEGRIAFFLTDGVGSLSTAAGSPLSLAIAAGTKVNTYGVGAGAGSCNVGANIRTIADQTGGSCTVVTDPTDLSASLGGVTPAGIDRVEVKLNGGPAVAASLDALGNWSAPLSGVVSGANSIVATVFADDGTQVSADITVQGTGSTNGPPVVDAGPGVSGAPGASLALDGTVSDPDGDALTTSWSVTGPCTVAAPGSVDTTVSCSAPGTYTATLTASDGVNPSVSDTTTVTIRSVGDTSPPACALVSASSAGISVRVGDTGSGLASVVATKSKNANVVVPAFTAGTTADQIVTATKIKAGEGAAVELTVTDVAGNKTVCDPVVAKLSAGETKSFSGVPAAEHYFSVSEAAGVAAVAVEVNGVERVLWSPNGKTVDLGELAAVNTIRVRVLGAAGTSATIMIWDGK